MKHNRWLDWKLRHGLATRGRATAPMNPQGLIARTLYKWHFKKYDVPAVRGPRTFYQNVGGSLGATGKVNGE